MPQFLPGEAKTAIAPITAKPAGMACEAELFLGPDELTKVASSGRVSFASTGAAQSVSLPITMPSSPGSYHGYIDVFTEGLRFLAYKTKEDVVIVEPYHELHIGGIAITACHGKKFIEIGIDPDGIPYAVAESPVVGVMTGLYLSYRNVSLNIPYGMQFVLVYEPTWSAGYPCDQVPVYWRNCSGQLLQGESSVCGVTGQSSWGQCCVGMYDAGFQGGSLNWQGWPDIYFNFRIKNILQCTVSRELPI